MATCLRMFGVALAVCAPLLWSCHSLQRPSGSLPGSDCATLPPSSLGSRSNVPARASTPAQVVAPLRAAIQGALCSSDANRAVLEEALARIDENLDVHQDVMPLGRVRVLLETADEPDDPGLREVLRVLATTQGSYVFDDVRPNRPTLFLVHGSDRGPFDTFAPYLELYRHRSNLLFVVYDSFQSTSDKAAWLSREIRAWRQSRPPHEALHVIAWSDGTTILRKARLEDSTGLFRGARIVNLAPPLAGSYRARWVDDYGPRRFLALPALFYLRDSPHLIEIAHEYNPYGDLMAEMYGPQTHAPLAERLGAGSELNIVVDGDAHSPHVPWFDFLEPEFRQFEARYRESLGPNHLRLPRHSENPHRDVTADPEAIEAVVRHLDAPSSAAAADRLESLVAQGTLAQ